MSLHLVLHITSVEVHLHLHTAFPCTRYSTYTFLHILYIILYALFIYIFYILCIFSNVEVSSVSNHCIMSDANREFDIMYQFCNVHNIMNIKSY